MVSALVQLEGGIVAAQLRCTDSIYFLLQIDEGDSRCLVKRVGRFREYSELNLDSFDFVLNNLAHFHPIGSLR